MKKTLSVPRSRLRWRPFSRRKDNSLWFATVDDDYSLTIEKRYFGNGGADYAYGDGKVRGYAMTISGAKERAAMVARKHARRILAAIGGGS